MKSTHRYHAFISYAHEEKQTVEWLCKPFVGVLDTLAAKAPGVYRPGEPSRWRRGCLAP